MKLLKIILFITFASLLLCLIPVIFIFYMCWVGLWSAIGFGSRRRTIRHI